MTPTIPESARTADSRDIGEDRVLTPAGVVSVSGAGSAPESRRKLLDRVLLPWRAARW